MSSQHNTNMTTSYFDIFFPHSKYPQIARLMHVNELGMVNIGMKSSINQNGLLGKIRVKVHNFNI
jgi:hypothetical protein